MKKVFLLFLLAAPLPALAQTPISAEQTPALQQTLSQYAALLANAQVQLNLAQEKVNNLTMRCGDRCVDKPPAPPTAHPQMPVAPPRMPAPVPPPHR